MNCPFTYEASHFTFYRCDPNCALRVKIGNKKDNEYIVCAITLSVTGSSLDGEFYPFLPENYEKASYREE